MAIRTNTLEFSGAGEWHRWLERNHDREREAWLVFYKKHTDRRTFTYSEALDEALCFGWIDSILRRIDEQRYMQRFTPRKRSSSWSQVNLDRAKRLISEGRMQEPGLERLCAAVPAPPRPKGPVVDVPPYIAAALRADTKATRHFNKLPPSQRRLCVRWIDSAKKGETKSRRLAEVLSLLRQGKRLGMK